MRRPSETGPEPVFSRSADGARRAEVAGLLRLLVPALGLLLLLAGPAPGQTVHTVDWYPQSGSFTWPTDAQWRASHGLDDGAIVSGSYPEIDFVGDASYPGFYWYRDNGYFYLRVRVNYGCDLAAVSSSTFHDSLFFILNNQPADLTKANWAFGWDTKSNDVAKHGLEMMKWQSGSGVGTQYGGLRFDDVDGQSGQKVLSPTSMGSGLFWDFNLAGNAYVRTVDHQQTTNTTTWGLDSPTGCSDRRAGDTAFVDVAVSCSYLSALTTKLAGDGSGLVGPTCGESWRIQLASIENATDHNAISYDVAGGKAPTDVVAGGWTGPTPAVVGSVAAVRTERGAFVTWETASEERVVGFSLFRLDGDERTKLNAGLLPSLMGEAPTGRYVVPEPDPPSAPAEYVVEVVEADGSTVSHGPFVLEPATARRVPELQIAPTLPTEAGRVRLRAPARSIAPVSEVATARGWPVEIGVRRTGLYRVDAATIGAAAGRSTETVARLIRNRGLVLTCGGRDVAYLADPNGKSIHFYGEALDSIYSDTNLYRLGPGAGQAWSADGAVAPLRSLPRASFVDRLHAEQDLDAEPAYFHDPEADFWLWSYLVAGNASFGRRSFSFRLETLAAGPGELALDLKGLSAAPSGRDHHVAVSLNGTVLGEFRWEGLASSRAAFSVPDGVLRAGENVVEVVALLDAGIPYSVFGVDSLDVAYRRPHTAVADALRLTEDTATQVTVGGFTTAGGWVLDLSSPLSPKVVPSTWRTAGGGTATVTFRCSAAGRPYLAVSSTGALQPAFVSPVSPSLKAGSRGADYLVITHPSLAPAARELAALRAARGYRTAVVTTDEIYDDFSYGVATPHAIRAFLGHALGTWRPAPRFVVLAGAGSFDYRNVLGSNDCLVPTLMADTPYGLAPADGRFADATGDDGVPDVAVGRIPASSDEQLRAYVTKLEAFEDPARKGSRRALAVADNPDRAGEFPSDSDDLVSLLPPGLEVEKLYLPTGSSGTEVRERLLAGLRSGVGFVSYVGHAGYDRLSAEGLLRSDDVPTLGNAPRLPVVAALTCLAGSFGFPGYDSLGETLVLQPDGGAIAVLAPTAQEMGSESRELGLKVAGFLFDPAEPPVGEAVRAAGAQFTAEGGPSFVPATYALLGDPAVEMGH